jgi:hypothetical protein
LLPCTALLTGFQAASRAFGPDPREDLMYESIFERRFLSLVEEDLRKILMSNFRDHKYVFDFPNDRKGSM